MRLWKTTIGKSWPECFTVMVLGRRRDAGARGNSPKRKWESTNQKWKPSQSEVEVQPVRSGSPSHRSCYGPRHV